VRQYRLMPEQAPTAAFPAATHGRTNVTVVIPCWNGRRWLPGLLGSLRTQTLRPSQTVVVDNGSSDGSVAYLKAEHPEIEIHALPRNTGFAHAVNRGIELARGELVALLNTDVVLSPDWLQRMAAALGSDPGAASVACKMRQVGSERLLYDAGDILRRDGACEQRGRFGRDVGQFDEPGEVFGACAGAALYRGDALRAVGAFDERFFAYLEDVDLALRLRLAGWGCRYEPVLAHHVGEGSSHQLSSAHHYLVERNTLLLVGKWFPLRWLPLVAYRQVSWLRDAASHGRLGIQLRGLRAGVGAALRAAGARQRGPKPAVPIEIAVPARPFRGPQAGGHREQIAATFLEASDASRTAGGD
jgi:GT2 family glycosyltransferase